jgi:uncharacterized cupredoxin-like copper-binding protein
MFVGILNVYRFRISTLIGTQMSFKQIAFAGALIAATVGAALATPKSIIFVSTMDKGATAPMANDHGLGMAHMKMHSDMGLHLSTDTVPAGDITFKLQNVSKDMIHEMLVFPVAENVALPYDDKQLKIDEEKAGSLGEVSEIDPGKAGELQINLKAGKYVLLCNLPGHFANGMWSLLTVK